MPAGASLGRRNEARVDVFPGSRLAGPRFRALAPDPHGGSILMTRRLMTMLAPLAVCVAALGFATSAHAAKHMEVALADDNVFVKGLWSPFKGLDKAKQLHATYIRANVVWSTALGKQARAKKQPKTLKYNWTPWDDLIQRAADRGIAV